MSPAPRICSARPPTIAQKVRERVRAEVGLPISVGVARTKHLAKIASQVAKPDGLCVVDPATEIDVPPRPAGRADVGRRARRRRRGSRPRASPPSASSPRCRAIRSSGCSGRAASEKLHALAFNRDPRAIETDRRARSAGAQSALGQKPPTPQIVRPTLRHLADRIGSRLRAKIAQRAAPSRCACAGPISAPSPAR